MSFYILDTDHLSLFERNHPQLATRLQQPSLHPFVLTIITAEEKLRGRFASIRAAKSEPPLIEAYRWLGLSIESIHQFRILTYDERASQIYDSLRSLRFRIGTQDLRIAAITLAVGGTLLTRNRRDFEPIPNLSFEDWTI
jgi:tRNA(fMet)-specific endonuclease VapC